MKPEHKCHPGIRPELGMLKPEVLPARWAAGLLLSARVLPSTLPSPPTRPQSPPSPPTRPQSLPPLPTGLWSPLLTLTTSALLSGHQPSHPPARPQSPADLPARPHSSASLTLLLPVEPLYFFPNEKVVFEEVVLEEVPEEDNGLFIAFTLQEEAHSQDEGPSTSTVSNFFILLSNVGYITCYTCMLMQTYACTFMHAYV